MLYIRLYHGSLLAGKVKQEMSPPPVAGFHQSPKKCKSTVQVGRGRMKVSFIPFASSDAELQQAY
jgi:hypothetical protein